MNTTHITVPETFARDHWSRGCFGTELLWEQFIVERKKHRVTLALTDAQIKELHSDADYYATSYGFSDPDFFGLKSSARAVRNAIAKQFPEVIAKAGK